VWNLLVVNYFHPGRVFQSVKEMILLHQNQNTYSVKGRYVPGEQESEKKIITDEDDWIIWRVKPPEVTRECGRGMTGIPRRSPTFLSGTGQD